MIFILVNYMHFNLVTSLFHFGTTKPFFIGHGDCETLAEDDNDILSPLPLAAAPHHWKYKRIGNI